MSDFSKSETPHGRQPRLLEQVHDAIRRLHYSRRTEETYVHWIKRFVYWSGRRHPASLGESEVTAFLSHLATERNVAAATQNQALAALVSLQASPREGTGLVRRSRAREAPSAAAGGTDARGG